MQLHGYTQKGIEMLVNLINIAYCAMKILPCQEKTLSKYQDESVQEFCFALSVQICQQIFYASLLQNIKTEIKYRYKSPATDIETAKWLFQYPL